MNPTLGYKLKSNINREYDQEELLQAQNALKSLKSKMMANPSRRANNANQQNRRFNPNYNNENQDKNYDGRYFTNPNDYNILKTNNNSRRQFNGISQNNNNYNNYNNNNYNNYNNNYGNNYNNNNNYNNLYNNYNNSSNRRNNANYQSNYDNNNYGKNSNIYSNNNYSNQYSNNNNYNNYNKYNNNSYNINNNNNNNYGNYSYENNYNSQNSNVNRSSNHPNLNQNYKNVLYRSNNNPKNKPNNNYSNNPYNKHSNNNYNNYQNYNNNNNNNNEIVDNRPIGGGMENSKNNPEEGEEKGTCSHCGRNFVLNALEKHERICQKVFQKKRKAFNTQKQRINDSEQAALMKQGQMEEKRNEKKGINQNKSSIPKWKLQSEEFRQICRGGSEPISNKNKNTFNSEISKNYANYKPSVITDSYIPCKFCNRKYNEEAYKKHLNGCERRYNDALLKNKFKKNNGNSMNEALSKRGIYGQKKNIK